MRTKITIIIVMLILVMSLTTKTKADQDKSLVLCFTFDQVSGENILDVSGNGNDGIMEGNPKIVNGKYGQGMDIKAPNDYVEVQDSDSLDVVEVTAMAWVNLTDTNADQKIIGKTDAGAYSNGYVLGVRIGNIQPECWDKSNGYFGDNGGTGVPSKEWTHIAIVYSIDNRLMLSYVNGKEQTRASTNGVALGINTNVLKIGRSPWNDSYPATGTIDEVRVYNRALGVDEISQAMEEFRILSVTPMSKLTNTWGRIKVESAL